LEKEYLHDALIVSITPYFLEKEAFWFEENLEKILHSAKTQLFFKENTLFVKSGHQYSVSEVLRKLDEMGYEKVFSVADPVRLSAPSERWAFHSNGPSASMTL